LRGISTEGSMRVSVVLCESGGNRRLIVRTPGTPIPDPEDFVRLLEIKASESFRVGEYMGMAGSLPSGISPEVVAMLVQEANRRKLTTIVDLTGVPLRQAVEARCSVIKVNRDEFMSSFNCSNSSELQKTAFELTNMFGCSVLITDGHRDAYGIDNKGE